MSSERNIYAIRSSTTKKETVEKNYTTILEYISIHLFHSLFLISWSITRPHVTSGQEGAEMPEKPIFHKIREDRVRGVEEQCFWLFNMLQGRRRVGERLPDISDITATPFIITLAATDNLNKCHRYSGRYILWMPGKYLQAIFTIQKAKS